MSGASRYEDGDRNVAAPCAPRRSIVGRLAICNPGPRTVSRSAALLHLHTPGSIHLRNLHHQRLEFLQVLRLRQRRLLRPKLFEILLELVSFGPGLGLEGAFGRAADEMNLVRAL